MTSSKTAHGTRLETLRVRSLFLSLARALSAFTRLRQTFNVKKCTHTFSSVREAVNVDLVSPYRRARIKEAIRRIFYFRSLCRFFHAL